MVRDTSVEAYQRIKEEGLLSRARFEVYTALYKHGPCTINELYQKAQADYGYRSRKNVQANFHARMGELRERGVVTELKERPCRVTGQRVIVWDVTSKLPVEPVPSTKVRCPTCKGRGHLEQGRLL